jgi:hypothetical protein
MPTELSYHIADFKIGDNNEIKILELGNAFYGSNLLERNATFNNHEAMLKHAAQYGSLEIKFPVFRSFSHSMKNDTISEISVSLRKFYNASTPVNPKIYLIKDSALMLTAGVEFIQEQHDEFLEKGNTDILFDGAIDTFYLCDRNKRILNKILQLNELEHYQPETWFYELASSEDFVPPSNIPFFIIKPMNESLGKGVLLVANEDLLALLKALKMGSDFLKQVGDIGYYRTESKGKVLIQRFYPGKTIVHQGQSYFPTARAVFAVVKQNDDLVADIIDIFWKLPIHSIQSDLPTASESVSYSGDLSSVQSQISLETDDYELVKKELKEKLAVLSRAIYRYDVKSYLFKLYETEQFSEIKYYLDHCATQRVRALDQELISLILAVDEKKAKAFLVTQAKYFAFPWHLNFKNICLKTWIEENLTQLEPSLLIDLQEFFNHNKKTIAAAPRNDRQEVMEYCDVFLTNISKALANPSKIKCYKQYEEQTFFGNKSLYSAPAQDSGLRLGN